MNYVNRRFARTTIPASFTPGLVALTMALGCGESSSSSTNGNTSASRGGAGDGSNGQSGNGGQTAEGGGGATSKGAPGVGRVATIGDACDEPGALVCAGNHQKVALICRDGKWVDRDVCESGQFCNSTEGPDAGLCADEVVGCDVPNELNCVDGDVHMCDQDSTASELIEECTSACYEAKCVRSAQCPRNNEYLDLDPLDCSADCGGPDPACAGAECRDGNVNEAPLRVYQYLDREDGAARGRDWELRTPAAPGVDDDCGCSDFAYAFAVSRSYGSRLEVTVDPPWKLKSTTWAEGFCNDEPWSNCLISETGWVIVATDDPAAPAVNVEFTKVSDEATCN